MKPRSSGWRSILSGDHYRAVGAVRETGYFDIEVPYGDARATAAKLRDSGVFDSVSLNFVREVNSPNDPLLLKRAQPYVNTIRLPQAWDVTHATGSRIAVLDTGIDLDHPDLPDNVHGRDFVEDDGVPQDDHGHGTHVAGVIAALTDNDKGLAGAAWGAKIMPVKVLGARGTGTDADIAAGITWAADHGADVINMSFSGTGSSSVVREAVAYARSKDAVLVGSSGKDGSSTPHFPAAYEDVLAVGSTDWSGNVAWYSTHGNWLDLTAPSWMMTTTALASGPLPDYDQGLFSGPWGSSYGAALVSGVAAMLASQHPDWTAPQIEHRLVTTAWDLGPSGKDIFFGAGLLDAYAAVGGPARAKPARPVPDDLEWNDTKNSASVLTPWNARFPTISPEGDDDWYRIDLSGDRYHFVLSPENYRDPRPLGILPVVDIYDPTGKLVAHESGWTVDSQIQITIDAVAGTYFAHVRSRLPARSAGTYGITFNGGPLPRDRGKKTPPESTPPRNETNGDSTPPETYINYAPTGETTRLPEWRFDFYSDEPGVTFECAYSDNPNFQHCQVPQAMGAMREPGTFTFKVRARDGAGNVDPTPAVQSWIETPLDAGPDNDSFDNADPIFGSEGTVVGTNGSAWYDSSPFSPQNMGGMSVWWRWTAPVTGTARFSTLGSNFDTLLAVHEGTYAWNSRLAFDDDDGPGLSSAVTLHVLEGHQYNIGVDGFVYGLYADNGDVTLSWDVEPDPPDRERHERSISLTLSNHLRATGAVETADLAACDINTPVVLQRRTTDGWKVVKTAISASDGTYVENLPDQTGRYRAVAKKRLLEGDPGDICERARSVVHRHRHG
ncbi:MAG: S8 family peptidase [Actinomycetota bacterium]|nr:S8 family peptidase [Actinomycetota bacterium]